MSATSNFNVMVLTAPPATGMEPGGAFVKVDGRECLLRSVELFLNRENVGQIQVVVAAEAAEEAKRKYGAHLSFSGVKLVVGGPAWMEQMAAGAGSVAAGATHVMVHDAARPVVPFGDIDRLMSSAGEGCASLAVPVEGRVVCAGKEIGGNVWAMQGTAVYGVETFRRMVKEKKEVEASEVKLVKGSVLNVRCGDAGDAGVVKGMLAMLPKRKKIAPNNPFEEAQW